MDFWISQWISGFQLGFLDFWISVWISADGVRDFFRDGPLGAACSSVMVRSCHACVVFVPRASFTSTLHSGSSPSPTRQWAGP